MKRMIKLLNSNPLDYRMSLKGDLLVTVINAIAVFFGIFILYGLLARFMGIDALGDFLLVRRTALGLLGVFLVGTNVGLSYYISQGEEDGYGPAALLVFAALTLPLIVLVSWFLHLDILKGFPNELAFPFGVFALAYALQFLAYGLLRGHLNMVGANLLQLMGTGLIPLAAFAIFYSRGVSAILVAIGVGTLLFSALVYLIKLGWGPYAFAGKRVRQLLSYGSQRLPSLAGQFILLGGVPLLILNASSKAEIAYVISGINMVRLFMVVVGPVGIILLPRISKAMARGEQARIAQPLKILCQAILLVGVPAALFLSVNSAILLEVWLGTESAVGTRAVQLIVLALPFYLLMEVLRAPIDAASPSGYNSITYGVAALTLLAVFFALRMGGLPSTEAGIISFIVGHLVAAIISLYYAYKFFGISIVSGWYLIILAGTAALALLLFYSVNALVPGFTSLLVSGLALVIVLGLIFSKSRLEWVAGFRSLLMHL